MENDQMLSLEQAGLEFQFVVRAMGDEPPAGRDLKLSTHLYLGTVAGNSADVVCQHAVDIQNSRGFMLGRTVQGLFVCDEDAMSGFTGGVDWRARLARMRCRGVPHGIRNYGAVYADATGKLMINTATEANAFVQFAKQFDPSAVYVALLVGFHAPRFTRCLITASLNYFPDINLYFTAINGGWEEIFEGPQGTQVVARHDLLEGEWKRLNPITGYKNLCSAKEAIEWFRARDRRVLKLMQPT